MFEISQKSFTTSEHPLMAIAPTDNCLDSIIALAKAADCVMYAGHFGSPFYLELPHWSDYEGCLAMFDLAQELGLTAWEYDYENGRELI